MAIIPFPLPLSEHNKVKLILNTEAGAIRDLAQKFQALAPESTIEALMSKLQAVKDIAKADALDIAEFAKRLVFVGWVRGGASSSEIVESIASFFDQQRVDWWDRVKWMDRKEGLDLLLSPSGPLYLMAKVEALRHEYAAVLINSHVLSDTRYVFDDDANIAGATTAQTLVLDYFDCDYDRKKQYIVLDGADIEILINQLQRATKKKEAIKAAMEQAKIRDCRSNGERNLLFEQHGQTGA